MESKFKSTVLTTYHKDWTRKSDEAIEAFIRESTVVRKQLKSVRDELHYRLKPSHGHSYNVQLLETLLSDFRRVKSECSDTLTRICTETEVSAKKNIRRKQRA